MLGGGSSQGWFTDMFLKCCQKDFPHIMLQDFMPPSSDATHWLCKETSSALHIRHWGCSLEEEVLHLSLHHCDRIRVDNSGVAPEMAAGNRVGLLKQCVGCRGH